MTLVNLFAGSASVEPLKVGLESSSTSISTNANSPAADLEGEINSFRDVTNDSISSGGILVDDEENSSIPNNSSTHKVSSKRKHDETCVPRLIDNKRRHLEKRVSQSQRDDIFLKEAKEEGLFKKELCQAIKDSNKVFADAMSDMSKSFMLMAETMKLSMQQIVIIQQGQQQQQQNQHHMPSAYQPLT